MVYRRNGSRLVRIQIEGAAAAVWRTLAEPSTVEALSLSAGLALETVQGAVEHLLGEGLLRVEEAWPEEHCE